MNTPALPAIVQGVAFKVGAKVLKIESGYVWRLRVTSTRQLAWVRDETTTIADLLREGSK